MKILFCSNTFQNISNGPAKFACLLLSINDLYPQHELRIITEDIEQDKKENDKTFVYGIKLRIPIWLKPLGQILRMFQYYQKVKQVRKEYNFDVLVYNNAFNGLWASWISQKPTIGMINDEKNIRAAWSNFQINRSWIKSFFFKQLELLSTQSHNAIITNSNFLRERVIKAYKIPEQKTYRLYKSIDFTNICFQPIRAFQSPIRVLFVKTDYRVGNLKTLIDALSQLTQYNFELTVIGPEHRFEKELRGFVLKKDTILLNYLGPQPQHVVYKYLESNDVFCVPSNTEALGVANIEALAHGIPVISSQVGGIPEVLDYGKNGWIVSPNSSVALATAFQECINNPKLRQKKSEQGMLFISRFSKEVMLQQFLTILEEACT